jgi:hypothetical protein
VVGQVACNISVAHFVAFDASGDDGH